MADNDMGKGNAGADPEGKAITDKTFEEAAKAFGMTKEEAMKNTLELIQQQLGTK
jgi:hypothetical protein